MLAPAGMRQPVATAARDDATRTGKSPAENVWWLHRHEGPLLSLVDLSFVVLDARGGAA